MASTKLAVGTTTDLWRDSSATAAHKSRGRWSGCLFMAALLATLGIMLAAHRQMVGLLYFLEKFPRNVTNY